MVSLYSFLILMQIFLLHLDSSLVLMLVLFHLNLLGQTYPLYNDPNVLMFSKVHYYLIEDQKIPYILFFHVLFSKGQLICSSFLNLLASNMPFLVLFHQRKINLILFLIFYGLFFLLLLSLLNIHQAY